MKMSKSSRCYEREARSDYRRAYNRVYRRENNQVYGRDYNRGNARVYKRSDWRDYNRGNRRECNRGYSREYNGAYWREYSRDYNRDSEEEEFVMKNDPKYFVSNDPNHPDYHSGLRQIGFYLDPTIDKVDLNTIPKNGTEFIVKSKMQEEAMGLYDCYEDDEYFIEDLFIALRRAGYRVRPAQN